jgi:hypothetical protein
MDNQLACWLLVYLCRWQETPATDWEIMFENKNGTPAENIARLMAELVISIADNEADMGVPTGTAYDALWDVYLQFEGTKGLQGIADDARRVRKVMRKVANNEGWELDVEYYEGKEI